MLLLTKSHSRKEGIELTSNFLPNNSLTKLKLPILITSKGQYLTRSINNIIWIPSLSEFIIKFDNNLKDRNLLRGEGESDDSVDRILMCNSVSRVIQEYLKRRAFQHRLRNRKKDEPQPN